MQDIIDIQIDLRWLYSFGDDVALIGLESVTGLPVFVRVDGHRSHVEFASGAHCTDGNFGPIDDEK
jgi:hypothetical protein